VRSNVGIQEDETAYDWGDHDLDDA
jgi:hypothetical protein